MVEIPGKANNSSAVGHYFLHAQLGTVCLTMLSTDTLDLTNKIAVHACALAKFKTIHMPHSAICTSLIVYGMARSFIP